MRDHVARRTRSGISTLTQNQATGLYARPFSTIVPPLRMKNDKNILGKEAKESPETLVLRMLKPPGRDS